MKLQQFDTDMRRVVDLDSYPLSGAAVFDGTVDAVDSRPAMENHLSAVTGEFLDHIVAEKKFGGLDVFALVVAEKHEVDAAFTSGCDQSRQTVEVQNRMKNIATGFFNAALYVGRVDVGACCQAPVFFHELDLVALKRQKLENAVDADMGIGFVVDGIGADYDNAEVIRPDGSIMVEDTLDEILRGFVEAPEDIGVVYFFPKRLTLNRRKRDIRL